MKSKLERGCQRERVALKGAYRNRAWYAKVNRMSDEQVIAIYERLKAQKKVGNTQ